MCSILGLRRVLGLTICGKKAKAQLDAMDRIKIIHDGCGNDAMQDSRCRCSRY